MKNIDEFRLSQIENKFTIFKNLVDYILMKKEASLEYTIDDDIWNLETTKGFNTGICIKFSGTDDKYTKILVPYPNEFDFFVYKQVPRLLQNRLVDDVISIYRNGIRFEAAKFIHNFEKDPFISLLSLFCISSNYNCLFNPDIFSFDSHIIDSNSDLFSKLDSYYNKYIVNYTLDKKQNKVILFVKKNFVISESKCNDLITKLVSNLDNKSEYAVNIQIKEMSFITYELLCSMFPELNKRRYDPEVFNIIYNKVLLLSTSLFLSLVRLTEFSHYYKQLVVKHSSIQYKYISSYQQIFHLTEKAVTNAIRKISKRKKQKKDDELTNLATEIVRLPSFKFTEIYNPFTEMRTITSCEIPIDNLSNEMRSIDKSMYNQFCPVDTSDKDPGKILRATPSLRVDDVGRYQANFVYTDLVKKLRNEDIPEEILNCTNTKTEYVTLKNITDNLNISKVSLTNFDNNCKNFLSGLKINL